ncbi:putative reverse transcriptase domain-containing protein [Tanacetum coccineum]
MRGSLLDLGSLSESFLSSVFSPQPTRALNRLAGTEQKNRRRPFVGNSGAGRDQRNRGQQSHRSTNSGSQQSRVPSEGYTHPVCNTCGRRHPGECRRAAGTCFKCGQAGHLQRDCKKNTGASSSGHADKKPDASGRVFALTQDQAANTSGTITGALFIFGRAVFVLFDTGATHSVISTKVFASCFTMTPDILDHIRSVNALPLDMCEFDIILGIDWLAAHRATIDCHSRRVIFGDIHAPEFIYHADLVPEFPGRISRELPGNPPIPLSEGITMDPRWFELSPSGPDRPVTELLSFLGLAVITADSVEDLRDASKRGLGWCTHADGKRELNMRQRRWLELLKDYDTNIQYHPGKANMMADALSRKSGMIAGIKLRRIDGKSGQYQILSTDRVSALMNDGNLYGSNEGFDEDVSRSQQHFLRFVWKWDEISMDFVTGLPRTQRKHDAIWVVVDRLTKSAHFLPIRKDYPVSKLAEMFQQEIVRLHGTPSAISERTIQTLEDMLRSCALEWAGNWDDYICLVEFAYNNSWHASIKCAPFEMLYGRKCRAPICWDQVGERILEGPEMIEVTNEKVAVAEKA